MREEHLGMTLIWPKRDEVGNSHETYSSQPLANSGHHVIMSSFYMVRPPLLLHIGTAQRTLTFRNYSSVLFISSRSRRMWICFPAFFVVLSISAIFLLAVFGALRQSRTSKVPPLKTGCIPWLGCAIEFGKEPLNVIRRTQIEVRHSFKFPMRYTSTHTPRLK